MDTYPIAGQVIEPNLFFGLSAKDIGQIPIIPLLFLGFAQSLGISGALFLWTGGIGLGLGVLLLLLTPSAQRPLAYARATIAYYLGTTTYHNRPSEHDRPRGTVRALVRVRQAGLTPDDISTDQSEEE